MKRMELRLISFSILLVVFAAGAAADIPPRAQAADVESARAALLRFSEQAASVPGIDRAAVDQARIDIGAADANTIISIHATLQQLRGWQLPTLAAGMTRADGAECARQELIVFAEQLGRVTGMDPAAAEQARRTIATAPDEVIAPLYAALEPVSGWQQLPAVIGEISRQVETQQTARVKKAVDEAINGPGTAPQDIRGDLLLFVSMLRSFAPLVGPELTDHLNFLESRIASATEPELVKIRQIFAAQAQGFRIDLSGRGEGGLRPGSTSQPCDSICSDDPFGICDAICGAIASGINAIKTELESAIGTLTNTFNSLTNTVNGYIGQVNSLVSQVNGFINQISQFVTDAFNATANMFTQITAVISNLGTTFSDLFSRISSLVTAFWDQLIALVPTSPEAAFALLTQINVNSTAWVNELIARFPILDPPCPAAGTDMGPLGVVGTLAAAQKSDGLAKLVKILYDVSPSDVPGLPVKVKVAAVYHPVEYWNLCARSRYAIAQYDLESAHRDLLTTNLNVPLSSRGTLASVLSAGNALGTVDQNAGIAESKLDALGPKNDELLRRLDTQLSTRALQTSVDAMVGTIRNLDTDVAKVESKLDMLQTNVRQEATNESDFQSAVAAFDALMARLAIEDNLLETSNNNVISLFQLPEAFGGNLSLVRSVVEKTINAMLAAGQGIQNAQKELERGDALMPVGDFAGAFKQFRKAYSEAVKP